MPPFFLRSNSSFQYRDKSVDVRRIARELGVRYVVEGSVRKLGNRIRITAQLIDGVQAITFGASGSTETSKNYSRSKTK